MQPYGPPCGSITSNLVRTTEQLYDKATMQSTRGWFRTTIGIRQECLLSSTPFNIFLKGSMIDALGEHDGKNSETAEIFLRFGDDIDALAEEKQKHFVQKPFYQRGGSQ